VHGAADTVRRLIDAGLLSTRDVVDGSLTVVDLSRSNAVWLVDAGRAGSYVAKVAAPDRGDLQGSGVVETMLYERIAGDRALAAAAPVARLVGRYGDLIVLASAGEGDGLARRLHDRGPAPADGRLLGEALGRWRAVGAVLAQAGLPGRLPWVASALAGDRPAFLDQHPATRELGGVLRRDPALRRTVEAVARDWRRETVMHGDVRWDNVVVTRRQDGGAEEALLVDLEFADLGDPAWDVAGAVAEPLAMAAGSGVEPGDGEGGVVVPDRRTVGRYLRDVRPFLACFASAYKGAATGSGADDDLLRAMGYVPARLVQAAFLHAGWNPSSGMAVGLALAGLAAALTGQPHLLAGMLRVPRAAVAAGPSGHGP